jgi:hypothetical protein
MEPAYIRKIVAGVFGVVLILIAVLLVEDKALLAVLASAGVGLVTAVAVPSTGLGPKANSVRPPPLLMLALLLAVGCSAQKKVEMAKVTGGALSCREKMSVAIQEADSCLAAAEGVRKVRDEDPMCKDLFRGTGFSINCGGVQ